MARAPYTAPKFQHDAYNCPICGAFAEQSWMALLGQDPNTGSMAPFPYRIARCNRCGVPSIWNPGDQTMMWPTASAAPAPSPDLTNGALKIFQEAASVLPGSPRAAAGLLRLCVESLCRQLGKTGSLNDAIADLVKEGMAPRIQQALDVVRVTGNNALHPGQIADDDAETAHAMFDLVNLIADTVIGSARRIEEMYGELPAEKLAQIQRRDGGA